MKEIVERVAKLAKLSVDEAELERYAHDLASILKHVDLINELDLSAIAKTAHTGTSQVSAQADEIVRSSVIDAVLAHAPEHDGTAFKVPKILE